MSRLDRCFRELLRLSATAGFVWLVIVLMALISPERLPS